MDGNENDSAEHFQRDKEGETLPVEFTLDAQTQQLLDDLTGDQGEALQSWSSAPSEENASEQSQHCEKEELPALEWMPLNFDLQEMRFVILEPHHGDTDSPVKCAFSFEPLAKCEPYTYIENTRGNPLALAGVIINGYVQTVTRNIAVFLNHIRSRDEPQRLWFRHLCLNHQDPEEHAHYWNQDWADTMMKHSEKVIDLSEVMAQLWDDGQLPRPFPRPPKDWNNPREPKPTKHHPARFPKDISDPPPDYKYLPLDYVLDEFRLVAIWCAANEDDPLVAQLAHSVMHDDVAYHALSYTWGSNDDQAIYPILLNGQRFMIRKNLDRCLRELRHESSKINVWIDAVCIDQNSVSERNRQIPRMLEIYEAADVVITWLGEPDECSDIAIELLEELKGPKLRADGEGNWGPPKIKENGDWTCNPIPDLPRRLAALYRFFLRPYFRRIWIIQEVAVATLPSVYCGKKRATWEQLDFAAYHLIDILHCSAGMAARMMAADPALVSVSDRDISFVRRYFYLRHLRVKNQDHWMGRFSSVGNWINVKDTSPGILDCMVLGRDFESTSPHDKIFALLNLAKDIDGIDFKPDYSKSLSQTYQEFAIAVANTTQSLDIICAAEPLTRAGLSMPAWCPDWSTPSTASSLIRHDHIPNVFMSVVKDRSGPIYSACGPSSLGLTPRFLFNGPVLEIAGLILDTISFIAPYKPNSTLSDTFGEWMASAADLCQTPEEFNSPDFNTPFMQKFWSMVAGDSTGVWGVEKVPPRSRAEEQLQEVTEQVGFAPVDLKKDEVRHRMGNTADDVYGIVTRGRTLVVTEGGLMGLAPWWVGAGWKLGVLSGCSVPVLLEERDDGMYVFKGCSFVQGWMDGEILEELGLDTEEAWEVLDEGGRLKIV
jgi:hypothetical protein